MLSLALGATAYVVTPARGLSLHRHHVGPVMAIDPSIYQECAIYDMEMEQQACELQAQLAEATEKADASKEQVDRLESLMKEKSRENKQLQDDYQRLQTENAKQQQDGENLRIELEKQVQKTAEASAAASALEKETTKLLEELDAKVRSAASHTPHMPK